MTLLQAEQISLARHQRPLLQAIDLSLAQGELVGLIGPNGAGKSTLLQVLAGLQTPQQGSIQLAGRPLAKWGLAERSRYLAWVEQQGAIHWPVTVERLVSLGRLPHLTAWQMPTATDAVAIDQALRASDLIHLRDRDATTLSGGERARVLLARALAGQPQILLADEPVAALDLGHQLQTMQLLREFARHERGAIVVLHDLSLAARYCDRLYLMQAGRIVAQGTAPAVLTPERLSQVYGVECQIQWQGVPVIMPVQRLTEMGP